MLAKKGKVVIDDDEYPVNWVEVLSSDDCLDYGEEVIMIETAWKWDCLVFSETVKAFTNDVQSDLHILKVMNVCLLTNYRHEQVDQIFVSQ